MTTATRHRTTTRHRVPLTVRLQALEAEQLFVGVRDRTLDPSGFVAAAQADGLDALARHAEQQLGRAMLIHPDPAGQPNVFERQAATQRRDRYWRTAMGALEQATCGHPSVAR